MKNFLTSVSMVVEEESRVSFRFLKSFLIAISVISGVLLFAYTAKIVSISERTDDNVLDFMLKMVDGLC